MLSKVSKNLIVLNCCCMDLGNILFLCPLKRSLSNQASWEKWLIPGLGWDVNLGHLTHEKQDVLRDF